MTLTNGGALFGVLFSIHAIIQLTEAEIEDPLASNVKTNKTEASLYVKGHRTQEYTVKLKLAQHFIFKTLEIWIDSKNKL